MAAFACETERNKIVSGITIRPKFGQSPALLGCNKETLRWPGSFGFGFLSPQPPGIVGAGPNAEFTLGPTRVGPFLILGLFSKLTRVIPGCADRRRPGIHNYSR